MKTGVVEGSGSGGGRDAQPWQRAGDHPVRWAEQPTGRGVMRRLLPLAALGLSACVPNSAWCREDPNQPHRFLDQCASSETIAATLLVWAVGLAITVWWVRLFARIEANTRKAASAAENTNLHLAKLREDVRELIAESRRSNENLSEGFAGILAPESDEASAEE